MPEVGLEPTHPCGRLILSQLRLPFRHSGTEWDFPFYYKGIRGSRRGKLLATKVAIIAGFEPFAEFDKNPSGDAVAFIQQYCQGFAAQSLVLPVCCQSSWTFVKQAVDKLPPDAEFALVMAGMADKREAIEIERFALNCKDYRIPDNEKHQWTGEEIVEGADTAIRSRPVDKQLLDDLLAKGFNCRISSHAGTFVCNEVYFRALLDWQNDPRCAGVVFVHVPPPANYREPNAVGKAASRAFRNLGSGASANAGARPIAGKKGSGGGSGAGKNKKVNSAGPDEPDDVYPIYRYAEALSLIARYLLNSPKGLPSGADVARNTPSRRSHTSKR